MPGLPQGSPLSPVLFNVYTAGITKDQAEGPGRTLSFADDMLIYRHDMVATDLQGEIYRISEWYERTGAQINPAKASVTWLSVDNKNVNTPMWRRHQKIRRHEISGCAF